MRLARKNALGVGRVLLDGDDSARGDAVKRALQFRALALTQRPGCGIFTRVDADRSQLVSLELHRSRDHHERGVDTWQDFWMAF